MSRYRNAENLGISVGVARVFAPLCGAKPYGTYIPAYGGGGGGAPAG